MPACLPAAAATLLLLRLVEVEMLPLLTAARGGEVLPLLLLLLLLLVEVELLLLLVKVAVVVLVVVAVCLSRVKVVRRCFQARPWREPSGSRRQM